MERNHRLLRVMLLMVPALFLAIGLEALQIATQPKQYEEEPRVVREAGEIDLAACALENAEIKSEALILGSGGGSLGEGERAYVCPGIRTDGNEIRRSDGVVSETQSGI